MGTLKQTLLKVLAGIGMWILLLIFNTRNGEAGLNSVKIVLDVILAVMLVGRDSVLEKRIALGVAVITTVVTFLKIPSWIEMIELLAVIIISVFLLHFFSEDLDTKPKKIVTPKVQAATPNVAEFWKEMNRLNPLFEKYSYSSATGITIQKGILARKLKSINTKVIRIGIDQSVFQRMLGLCDVSFYNSFTGAAYGNDIMHNIKLKSAEELYFTLFGVSPNKNIINLNKRRRGKA